MKAARTVGLTLLAAACAPSSPPSGPPESSVPVWQKIVVDPAFRSEAIAAGDVDRDGDLDLLAGDCWYEAPTWLRRPIRDLPDYGDGSAGYSRCFACFANDVDRDGWLDQIVIGMPGTPALWYRNPGAANAAWSEFTIHAAACNESPAFVDLFGDGQPVLLMGDGERLIWCSPGPDPRAAWQVHAISTAPCAAAVTFAHGLGTGDVDGDGRRDVLTPHRLWLQPPNARMRTEPWREPRSRVGLDCAQMYTLDVDADGATDLLSSSAHARGIWWHPQRRDADGATTFTLREIATHVTQTHALGCADVDGDGGLDLVTGKRWWAHGPNGDIDPNGTPWLSWIRIRPGNEPRFDVHTIDDASGVGTQFVVADIDADGRTDVAVANKRGVHLFLQRARRGA